MRYQVWGSDFVTTKPKLLAQLYPAAATPSNLYDCPADIPATIVSSLAICNQGAADDAVRVSISAAGSATASKDYLYYDLPLPGHDTFVASIDITLMAGDILRVRSTTGTTSFNLFGTLEYQ